VILDLIYDTYRDAKISFARYYHKRGWDEKTRANWSRFFHPEQWWVDANRLGVRNGEKVEDGGWRIEDGG
jgi:hypothetical protein